LTVELFGPDDRAGASAVHALARDGDGTALVHRSMKRALS
jgi:hypothetical protein